MLMLSQWIELRTEIHPHKNTEMKYFSYTKLVSLLKKNVITINNTPPPNKQANQRTLPSVWANVIVPPWVSCHRGGDRDADVSLQQRHVMLSIRFAALMSGIWITRGSVSYPCWEKKGDLVYLKEHAGLRGLFPQRGDMRVSDTHRALSLALLPHVVREPSFDFSPFLSFIMLFLFSPSLSLSYSTSSSLLPSRHGSFLLLLLL